MTHCEHELLACGGGNRGSTREVFASRADEAFGVSADLECRRDLEFEPDLESEPQPAAPAARPSSAPLRGAPR